MSQKQQWQAPLITNIPWLPGLALYTNYFSCYIYGCISSYAGVVVTNVSVQLI